MKQMNGLTPWLKVAALGAVVGSRSMLMPALVSRTARVRRGARVWPVLAALEMAADKTPWIPSRTSALSLVGRMLLGGAIAFGLASSSPRGWGRRSALRRMPVGAALVSASSAAASAFLLRALRERLGGTRRGGKILTAVCEDLLALGAGRALTHTLAA